MSVAPTGRIDAVRNDARRSRAANFSEVYYAFSTDGGDTWSKNVAVSPGFNSHLGWPSNPKLGDYCHMISDRQGTSLAYAATFNGEQDVYFLRIAPDCNDNGIHDGDDIAAGRSRDVNGDGLPDECEGVACDRIERFVVSCRRHVVVAKVESSLPPGSELTLNDNGVRGTVVLDKRGNVRLRLEGQTGIHTVFVEECPNRIGFAHCERISAPISGSILLPTGPVADVDLRVDERKRATSDASGFYRFFMPIGWTGKVVPELGEHRFDPRERSYVNLRRRQRDQDYTVLSLPEP